MYMYVYQTWKKIQPTANKKKTLGFLANFSFHFLVDLCKFNVVFANHNT